MYKQLPVVREVLEAEDVQHGDGVSRRRVGVLRRHQQRVDAVDQPAERPLVDGLCDRIAARVALRCKR